MRLAGSSKACKCHCLLKVKQRQSLGAAVEDHQGPKTKAKLDITMECILITYSKAAYNLAEQAFSPRAIPLNTTNVPEYEN